MTSSRFPSSPNLQDLVVQAKKQLAQRLSIPTDPIDLVEVREVIWPDASLGCPQPGMMYAQILTPGYMILLQAGNTTFEFHASKRGTQVIHCENPTASAPFSSDVI